MAAGRVLAPPAPSAATRAAEQTDEEQPGAAQVNGDAGVLRLRWNSHVESLQELFESLLDQQLFVDVTLACDGGSLRAHRVMLSAVSSYFRRVLSETTSKCPVIIMRDVPAAEMHFILQFIYRGEIHVPEDRLPSLLRTARLLEIRGLSDKLAGEDGKEKPAAEVGNNVNPIANGNGNGRIAGRGTRDSLFKTKRPTQLMQVKEEDLDEDEDMESDCDVPDGRQMTTTGNGNHSVSEDRTSPSVPPLDLSNGASDEENEVPSCKKRSTRTKSSSHVSPLPALVKCEQAEEEMDEELEDEEELDEELLDEEEELIEATTGHHHQGGSSNGASFPFGLSASSTSGSSAATPTGAGGGSGLVVQAVCPFCFKDCKRTAELRAHIRAHTGEKPFRCDICSAPFARSAHLKRHRRVHTGERPFECHRCQKTFSRQDKLKLHMDRHRLRDTGGSKMIVGRPKKLPGTGTNSKKSGPISDAEIPGTSSSSSEMMNGVNNSSSAMSGMGQFAFPGAPARPSSSQSSSSSASAPSSRSTPYGDLNYFSLLSLSQRGLTISSSPGSSPSGSSVPHLLSPQTLQELHLFQQRQHQQQQQQHRPGRPVRSTRSGGPQSRHLRDSASETLLNFAQQVVEVVAAPSAAASTTQS